MSFRNIFYKFVPFRWISELFGKNQQNPSTNPVETPKTDSISGTCKSRPNRTKSYSARDYSKPLTPKYGVNVNYRPAQENRYTDDNWYIEHYSESCEFEDYEQYYDNGLHGDCGDYGDFDDYGDY